MREVINDRPALVARRRGVVLLTVLLIVLAITILATGFLARADTELACGTNVLVRLQMDQLAESGLEHARGLVLHPQNVPAAFWTDGAPGLQLVAPSRDYYDIVRVSQDPNHRCTFDIMSKAYRLVEGQPSIECYLEATLRLDPCVGLWANGDINFRQTWILHGDMRSGGQIVSRAAQTSIDGDVFCTPTGWNGLAIGQNRDPNQLALSWPPVTKDYTNPAYASGVLGSPVSGGTWQPAVWHYTGNLILGANATVQGMLLVEGNLTVRGNNNRISAAQNLPALYVSGNLVIENAGGLEIDGLAVVEKDVRLSATANVTAAGALFVGGTLFETTADDSAAYPGLVRGNPTWTSGQLGGALQLNGPGDFIDCGTNPAFDITDRITVAAWVKTQDAGDGRHHPYVTKGDHAYALKHRHLPGDSSDYLEFFIYDGAAWQSAHVAVNAGFNNTWHHVAGTYDRSKVRLYVDGNQRAEASAGGPIWLHTEHALLIGANCEWPDRSYHGAIDDVRLYNVALDATAINRIMRNQNITTSPVARWRLDDPGSRLTVIADPREAAVVAGASGNQTCWSPAAGGFFRSIGRPY